MECYKTLVFYSVFVAPGPPGEVQMSSTIKAGSLLDVSWDLNSAWRAQAEVQKAQVEVPRAVLDSMLRYPGPPGLSGTRGNQVKPGPKIV